MHLYEIPYWQLYHKKCDISCTICKQQYVGQTKRQFRIRIGEHLADIRHKRDSPVALHFNKDTHTVSALRCEIIESLKGNPEEDTSKALRDRREQFWIHQLQTKHPNGINKRDRYLSLPPNSYLTSPTRVTVPFPIKDSTLDLGRQYNQLPNPLFIFSMPKMRT